MLYAERSYQILVNNGKYSPAKLANLYRFVLRAEIGN